MLETVPLTWLGVRCALAYLVEMQDGYHLADFIPTLLESPLFAGAGESNCRRRDPLPNSASRTRERAADAPAPMGGLSARSRRKARAFVRLF